MPTPRNPEVTSASGEHSQETEIQPEVVNSHSQVPSRSAHYDRGMSGSSSATRPALSSLDSSSNGDHSENDDTDCYEIAVRRNSAEDTLAEQYSIHHKMRKRITRA